jgi:hypothetical protein
MQYKQKVIAHPTEIIIKNAFLIVNEKGRKKVLLEKRKNVHAKIGGEPIYKIPKNLELRELYYNPYFTKKFIYKDNQKVVEKLDYVLCKDNLIFEIINM